MFQGCSVPGHGKHYIGAEQGGGFRTDRCPRDWANDSFVNAVQEAWFWTMRPGGGVEMALGPNPPAVLLDGIVYFTIERDAAVEEHREWRAKQAEDEAERKAQAMVNQR